MIKFYFYRDQDKKKKVVFIEKRTDNILHYMEYNVKCSSV